MRFALLVECLKSHRPPPILFLIYLNDLLHHLQRVHRVRRQVFADDLLLWIVGDFRDGVVHPDLMRAMGMVERWSLEW